MKKLFFIMSVFFLGNLDAQTTHKFSRSKFHYGLKAVGSISNVNGEDMIRTYSNRIGYGVGVSTKYELNKNINIIAEVQYQNIGAKVKNRHDGVPGNYVMENVAVPVLLAFEFSPKFYAETGAKVAFNLSSKITTTDGKLVASWKEYTKPINVSWAIGAGYNLTNRVTVNGRYNLALLGLFKTSNTANLQQFRTNHFELGIIYFLQ